jgi:hypothetical protein
MPDIDWARYRACPVCPAELGHPCFSQTGTVAVLATRPHGGRKLRTGYARKGGDR